jgi:adenine-specific DNA-methyltransferase
MHFLIEGDNLASLKLLEKTHKGKIDLIYIDPPYNTGSKDFIYDDAFVDKTDLFSHSKWLSFMECRLKIARRLLSECGSIFISIDDNEQAPLKLLCDDIFGEEYFVADVSWQRAYSPRNDSKGISSEKEHILVYSRSLDWSPNKLPRTEKMNSKYKNPDGDDRLWRTSDAFAPSAATHQGMVYAIQHPFTGKFICVTGKLNHFTRDSINEKIISLGAKAVGSVSKKTDYLITNESSGSSKYKKAIELNIPIITEEYFLKMLDD